MFTFAILIGIYSYLIFSLGVLGLLYRDSVIITTIVFISVVLFKFKNKILNYRFGKSGIPRFMLLILGIQILVNLVGALGPELSFDALWYHLTLPKIFLENHKIFHVPGGLLYYSDMPKLGEMLYIPAISFFSEIGAKIVHFSFGILVLISLYKLARKFMDPKFSILASIIFYGNLVVGWQSTTAYIDLARTFFEVMAVWGLINYTREKEGPAKRGWFIESAAMLGLSISTKLLSLGTLFVFIILIIFLSYHINKRIIPKAIMYFCIALYVAMPWFLFSFLNTGNPVYPFFSNHFNAGFDLSPLNPIVFLKTLWNFFIHSSDPISPAYVIFSPFVIISFRKLNLQLKVISVYFFLSLIIWIFLPARESRYMLPALAVFSVTIAYIIQAMRDKFVKNLSIVVILVLSLLSILYRGAANSKFLPVITRLESKEHFLSTHLNFNFGDFYDTDGYFKKNIKASDKVLLYGFHNLFYIDFPFVDSSYVKKNDKFNYIAVQKQNLPERFKFWRLIYSNKKTHVDLYSLGGQEWLY